MIVADGGDDELANVHSLLAEGYAGGQWTGSGIISSTAAGTSSPKMALGYGVVSELNFQAGVLDGINVNSDDVLVRYTLNADLNLDGAVGNADLNILNQHFLPSHPNEPPTMWSTGDTTFDGLTNNTDLNALRANFQATHPTYGLSEPNLVRTLAAIGATIRPVEGEQLTCTVASFTDSLVVSGFNVNLADYTASVEWGNGNFLPAQVELAGGEGQFNIVATVPASIDPKRADPCRSFLCGWQQ
jgi:hypothetical protein